MFRSFLFAVVFCSFTPFLSGQQLAVAEKVDLEVVSLHNDNANWSFYADDENKLYYLDFEMLNFNLKEIIVRNEDKNIVKQENVEDLPVDTIFELDFSDLPKGEYSVELHSFNGLLIKKITI